MPVPSPLPRHLRPLRQQRRPRPQLLRHQNLLLRLLQLRPRQLRRPLPPHRVRVCLHHHLRDGSRGRKVLISLRLPVLARMGVSSSATLRQPLQPGFQLLQQPRRSNQLLKHLHQRPLSPWPTTPF